MRANISWRMFFILLILGILGSIAISPYMSYLLKSAQGSYNGLLTILFNQTAQAVITLTPVILVGLILSKRIGLSISFSTKFRSIFALSAVSGVILSLVIILLDSLFTRFGVSINVPSSFIPPLTYRLLATFYGGINQELIYRLFVMSFIIFITFKIKQTKNKKPTKIGIWLGIIISAIIFGITHLPTGLPFIRLTALVIVRSMVIDGIAGILYGFLFWKKGLVAAMIAHLVTDMILQF